MFSIQPDRTVSVNIRIRSTANAFQYFHPFILLEFLNGVTSEPAMNPIEGNVRSIIGQGRLLPQKMVAGA